MGFFTSLEARCREVDSLLCVGLDPGVERLTPSLQRGLNWGDERQTLENDGMPAGHSFELRKAAQEARVFCLRLIEATADQAAAFKPNSAFFEALGAPGMEVLQEVIAAIPPGIPVILDAKRGDIASTARAYARAVFDVLGAGAVTASPYLGFDSLEPFFAYPDRGVFLLCKTSNPGSADLQDLPLVTSTGQPGGTLVFEAVARMAVDWAHHLAGDHLGLVVGATQPEALLKVRAIAPQLWLLAPGVGAQGGDLGAALRAGLRADGLGFLVPVSRHLADASHPREAARELRLEINRHRRQYLEMRDQTAFREQGSRIFPSIETGGDDQLQSSFDWLPGVSLVGEQPGTRRSHLALAIGLLQAGCVRFGNFRLKSGLVSPIYIDMRRLVGYPQLLNLVAAAYLPLLQKLEFKRIAALPYAALPIATAISLQAGLPMIYPRKEVKSYGTQAEIEGVYHVGERVAVVDDLITTGGSKFEAIERLRSAGLVVQDIVVLIDRQSGADHALKQEGLNLHVVFTLQQLLDIWEADGSVAPEDLENTRRFLAESASQ